MLIAGHHTFEVLPAPGGMYIVFVNREAVAEHPTRELAAAHCERLKQQAYRQETPGE
jgi:hypothetical protein